MNETLKEPNAELNKLDIILIIAMIFSPFTALRVGPIGLTEISIILFCLIFLLKKGNIFQRADKNNFVFTKFWVIFFMFSIFGLFYNYVLKGHISGTPGTMIFDFGSYIFAAFMCLFLEMFLSARDYKSIWIIIKRVYLLSSFILLVLFVISWFTDSLAGYQLTYYGYFRPFANNIHHISMGVAPLPFIGLKLISEEKNKLSKVFLFVLVASNLLVANATGSLKVTIGFLAGILFFVFIGISRKVNNSKLRLLLYIIIIFSVILISSINYEIISSYMQDFFVEEDLSGARYGIYSSSLDKIFESPLVGYGPGPHAEFVGNTYYDAHQTVLTVGLQSGVFGILAYILLNYKLIKLYLKDKYIFSAYVGILLYALGGDILRRLPMWIFLTLFYYYSKNKSMYRKGELNE